MSSLWRQNDLSYTFFAKKCYNTKGETYLDYLSEVLKAAIWGEQLPEAPKWNKWLHRNLSDNHCEECLMLHECWFEKGKTPKWPHHPFCHCLLEDLSYNDVLTKSSADSAYSKFDPYLFDPNNFYKHGKNKAFESWGYSIMDSDWLKKEVEKQALEKYVSGDYMLGKLNQDGQRISIRVEIPRKDKSETVSFVTGWMVYPNGHIQLTTPYGGK